MVGLGKLVRFCLGLQSWMVLVLPVSLWVYFRIGGPARAMFLEQLGNSSSFFWTMTYLPVIGALSAVAWWALRGGKRSARVWALLASAVTLLEGGFSIILGVAGIVAFWRQDVVSAMANPSAEALAAKHRPGDGTHRYIEKAVPALSVISLIGAQILWGQWSVRNGLSYEGGALAGWGVFVLATNLGTLFHECGHLVAGWISDMTLRGFQVGPVAGEIRDGRWRFRFVVAGILGGGLVSLVPAYMKHFRSRMVIMVLGGPIASLVTGATAILLALTAKSMPWEPAWELFALLGTFGVIDFVVNMIPQRPESHYSDGSQIYQLVTNGPWVARHMAMARVSSSLTTPERPRDWDPALLQRAADGLREGREGLHLRLYLAMHYFDNGQTELGIAAMREALDQDPAATDALDADSFAEMAFYEAALAHDLERANRWWNRAIAKGDSQKQVDYGKAASAILLLEGKLAEASAALAEADLAAAKLPQAGAYEYDRWCLDVVRQNLAAANLARLDQATGEPRSSSESPILTAW